jgi:hypothetical protein
MIDKYSNDKYNNDNNDKLNLHPEDLFFSGMLSKSANINKPNFEDAKEFSIESVYSDKTFGIHKAWEWIKDDKQIKNVNDFCPGFSELASLQKK